MSQVINHEVEHSEEFYKQEVQKILAEIGRMNKKMESDQEEIERLASKSVDNLNRIERTIQSIESILR